MALSNKKKADIMSKVARIQADTEERRRRMKAQLEAELGDTMVDLAKDVDATLGDTKEILAGTAAAFPSGAPFVQAFSGLRGAIQKLTRELKEYEDRQTKAASAKKAAAK